MSVALKLYAAEPPKWGHSGVIGPSYESVRSEMSSLVAENPDTAKLVNYGQSNGGNPLELLVVKKPGIFKSRPTLLMTGSTHGDEYLSIEDKLPRLLLSKSKSPGAVSDFLDKGGTFVFVPIVNPDGFINHKRENARGYDLNRDWDIPGIDVPRFKETETRALRDSLDKLVRTDSLKYEITVDYHCCVGALLYPWSYNRQALPPLELLKHKAVAQLATQYLDIPSGTTGEVLGYYPTGTTKDYYFSKYNSLAFTFEGRHGVENQYVERHLRWWESLADFLATESLPRFTAWFDLKQFPFLRLAD